MSDELEPLDPKIASLLGALPKAPVPAELHAKVWTRVAASAAGAGPVAAQVVASGLAAKTVIPAVIGALIAGAAGGVAIDRAVRKPVVEVRYVEVPAPAPVKAPEPVVAPPPVEPPPVAPPVVVKPKPAEPQWVGEREAVEVIRIALLKKDAAAALDAVAKHRKRFPKGQFAEERDALEVQALAMAGRGDDAKAAAKRFTARYPGSVFEDAVEAAVR
ncbi:MAG: hypothetical protein QM723_26815 [Myxococcaceae bacterium]